MDLMRTTIHRTCARGASVLLAGLLAFAVAAQEPDAGGNPLGMTLSRDHAATFTGGQSLEVTVRITASTWGGLTAMGLYEQAPAGWTLSGMRAVSGAPPNVRPPNGGSGVLEFIWLTPPRAPVAFQYTLQIPPRDSGVRSLSGQVEYRLDGGRLMSNVKLSQLDGEADAIPVITLRGSASMTVARNAAFNDPGATATDREDGDISDRIVTSGQVDTRNPGRYTLVYGVTDSAGNQAEPVRRTVTIRESGTASPGDGAGVGAPAPGGGMRGVPEARDPAGDSGDEDATGGGAAPDGLAVQPDVVTGENRPQYALPRRKAAENGRDQAGVPEFGAEGGPDQAPGGPEGGAGGAGRHGPGAGAAMSPEAAGSPAGDAGEGGMLFLGIVIGAGLLVVCGCCWSAFGAPGWRGRRPGTG